MDQTEAFNQTWTELLRCAEKSMLAKDEVIAAQKDQIRYLEEQVTLLEGFFQKLKEAGNALAEKNAELEQIGIRQQKVLDEYQELFQELFSKNEKKIKPSKNTGKRMSNEDQF